MERSQSLALDASAWAETPTAHKFRGLDGQVRRRGTAGEHPFIEEVRQAARQQKGQAVSDWLEKPEPEPEPEPQRSKNPEG